MVLKTVHRYKCSLKVPFIPIEYLSVKWGTNVVYCKGGWTWYDCIWVLLMALLAMCSSKLELP